MSDYQQIIYEKRGPVAWVTLNRPRYRNAQSRLLREEMDLAFDAAVADSDVRVIVLAGAGEAFSAGHDTGTPEQRADEAQRPYPPGLPGQYQRGWDLNVANSMRWRDLPKPTIAAVQGYCIFGGWIIASAMDLIIAADDAKFLPAHFQ
jgi:enoyl-CoA hydratase